MQAVVPSPLVHVQHASGRVKNKGWPRTKAAWIRLTGANYNHNPLPDTALLLGNDFQPSRPTSGAASARHASVSGSSRPRPGAFRAVLILEAAEALATRSKNDPLRTPG